MIRKRNSGWQVDVFSGGKRYRRQFPTQHEAAEWEATLLSKLASGSSLLEVTMSNGDMWTMQSLLDAVEARHWKGTANEQGAVANAQAVVDLLGPERPPSHITSADVDAVVTALMSKGNSPATVNRKLAALSKLMRFALSRGLISRMPSMEKRKEKSGRIRFYTKDEELWILDWCEQCNPSFGRLIRFLCDTGCRLGEATRLQWRDVQPKHVSFWETKSGKPRTVPLTSRLVRMLADRGEPTAQVFEGWTVDRAVKAWDPIRSTMGLSKDKEAVLHTWRHTCASRLVQSGVVIQVVQQWLGHKTLTMTLRYSHLAPTSLDAGADALDALASQPVTATDLVR